MGHFYRPPDTSNYLDSDFQPKFEDMMSTAISEGKELITLGDFNSDYNNHHQRIQTNPQGTGFFTID